MLKFSIFWGSFGLEGFFCDFVTEIQSAFGIFFTTHGFYSGQIERFFGGDVLDSGKFWLHFLSLCMVQGADFWQGVWGGGDFLLGFGRFSIFLQNFHFFFLFWLGLGAVVWILGETELHFLV